MSYEPTEWKSGDVITSAKLNKMEQGIAAGGTGGGGVGTVHISPNEQDTAYVMDKTFEEIYSMLDSGLLVQIRNEEYKALFGFVSRAEAAPFSQKFNVGTLLFGDGAVNCAVFSATSSSGYPEYLFEED